MQKHHALGQNTRGAGEMQKHHAPGQNTRGGGEMQKHRALGQKTTGAGEKTKAPTIPSGPLKLYKQFIIDDSGA
jgi:hypothetical protein